MRIKKLLLFIIALLIAFITIYFLLNIINKPAQASIDIAVSTTKNKEDWQLILVNKEQKLPQNFEVELSQVQGTYQVDKRISEITKKMIADAKKEGISLLICSSYRSVEKQTELYNNKVSYFMNLGYEEDIARNKAAEIVAIPLTSEHHTGLAIDFFSSTYQKLDNGIADTKEMKWLYENAYKYGFILRYPKDKQDITGITYEPWHFRYVGIEAAKKIKDNNLCLEEYLGK